MTQEQRWQIRYDEVMNFMEREHRKPSRHKIEEHLMLYFIKHSRKLPNAGEMKEGRVETFKQMMAKMEEYKRKNRWEWEDSYH